MNFDKKDEDSGALFHLDKTQVFQDARAFNASPIQPKKCRILLTKIKCIMICGLAKNRFIGQWRSMEYPRSNRFILWNHKVIPTQRCAGLDASHIDV